MITFAQAEANTDGVCPTCAGRGDHAQDCPVPHVGWSDGTERCDRCRRGLEPGDGYLPADTERVGGFSTTVGFVCLPCAFADPSTGPRETGESAG